jgi:hypothetical protein
MPELVQRHSVALDDGVKFQMDTECEASRPKLKFLRDYFNLKFGI